MPDRPAADRTANLLLWFQQEPLRYRAEVRRRDQPAFDSEVVLKLALGRRVEFGDPMLSSVSSGAWREAAATYVREVFFRPRATPYQILGLAPGASAQAIKENFRLLMQLVHPDRQGARPLWPEAFAARANRAYGILRHDGSRADLDREEAARAARARETQQRAAAAAMAPTPRWPPFGLAPRRPPPLVGMPEWWTAGLGGFMRRHPAEVAFVVLLCGAALVISAMMWDGEAGSLTRATRAPSLPTGAPARSVNELVMTTVEPEITREERPPPVPTLAPAPIAAEAVKKAAEPGPRVAPPAPSAPTPPTRTAGEAVKPAAEPGASGGSREGDGSPKVSVATPLAAVATDTVQTVRTAVGARPDAAPAAPSVATDAGEVSRASATLSDGNPSGPAATVQPLTTAEIDALSAAFVDAYDRGRLDTFAALFDDDAETNLYRGRAAIRNEYGELFRLSEWRQMQLKQINWRRVGERAYAKGEIAVRIGWRDGREVEQRVAIDMEVARRDGRVVITRLAHQPSAP
jgi:hypothetical protein